MTRVVVLCSQSAFLLCQGPRVALCYPPPHQYKCYCDCVHSQAVPLLGCGSISQDRPGPKPRRHLPSSHSEFVGATSYHAEKELLALSHLKPDRKI